MRLIIEDKRKVKDPRPTTQGNHNEVIIVFIRNEFSSDLLFSLCNFLPTIDVKKLSSKVLVVIVEVVGVGTILVIGVAVGIGAILVVVIVRGVI